LIITLVFSGCLLAQTSLYSDDYGNTTSASDGDSVSLYTDRFGNTTGRVGDRNVSCYTDSFGNTTCN